MANFIEEIIEKDLAEGKVSEIITRFPPEPNGYLHIGHAKAICLNYYGTAVKYNGKCNLRFDDTNPVKEDDEFVRSIIGDVEWLGWKGDVYYASDYFDVMYETAVKLIKKGKAYVDDITPEQMRAMRGTLTEPGVESANRNRPIEESLALFEDMRAGKIADGALVLRAKIDMASPNINMRDPIIYRVLKATHHRQGDKWCIYPMYDFAHPIEDAVEGITHSICTLEFEDHRPLYDWVLTEGEFENPPHQYEFARLNLERTIMSKRYLKKLVDEGFVDGWDDPRMPTIAGLRRRGYTPTAVREFCERIGVAKANSEVEYAQLESCIRDELNITADRVMAVLNPLELVITNLPDDYSETLEIENNPQDESKGTRQVPFSKRVYIERDDFAVVPPPKYKRMTVGANIRLKGAYIVNCTGYDEENGEVVRVYATLIEGTKSGQDNSAVKAKGVIHWVDAQTAGDVTVNLYESLLLPYDGVHEDFSERLNPNSRVKLNSKVEKSLIGVQPLKAFQFMRQGYFCRDPKTGEFNQIVSLKDSYKK
ncbi:MAG: glutamine--tRNA ligase/YqeY domain fusion protein [Clostridia bacterium]|nr:glutamine--tRNA ligase/YqeY domain fusion protein [Clostridia bacterium]MBR6774073.1 glutamine--tRNA ligase/YqeY domain fusion protein [Clostridia bacterium]MBR7141303.1 glutamine--tRNA ligase/YqeY domain fusion protein [Clostridia bacterium]